VDVSLCGSSLPHRTLHALISAGENFITIEEFRPFCETHQSLLNPLFAVQDKLRAAAMGTAFWENMSKRKIMLGHGHEVPLNELMVRVSYCFSAHCM
jgi:hypothetical protein